MKWANLIFFCFIVATSASAQLGVVDSFINKLSTSKADTNRVNLLVAWAEYYNDDKSDSVVMLSQQSLELARKLHYSKGEARSMIAMGNGYYSLGNYIKAVQLFQQALTLSKSINYPEGSMGALNHYTLVYYLQGNYRKELSCYLEVEQQARKLNNLSILITALGEAGKAYSELNQLDSATLYFNEAYQLLKKVEFNHPKAGVFVTGMAFLEAAKDQKELALSYFQQAIPICIATNAKGRLPIAYLGIASVYRYLYKRMDSALYYSEKAFTAAQQGTFSAFNITRAGSNLAEIYDSLNDYKQSLYYYKAAAEATESILNHNKIDQLSNLVYSEQLKQQELKAAKERYSNEVKLYALLAALVVFLIIGFILYQNNQQKQKAKIKIEQAYEALKATQAQLIQSEKMASLGELTAGIAHEIQNPLNFVNNFSEVNKEMIDEATEEIDKGNIDEVKNILNDIKDNEEKINHHGKRADAIVKGMLQHSRTTTGTKETTDINALANEYFRLSYHGMRAKNKDFNATLKTDFDESIGSINIIPQDIGRVFLNLYNNAFYAVNEKNTSTSSAGQPYEPTVSVSTKKLSNNLEIRVKDNGNGIPQKVVDKIFQPFFTTKPTGEGTGLGLSLSYDIIKAHGGEIKVETKEDEGTVFIIQLPSGNKIS